MRREEEVDRRHFKKTSFTLSSGKYATEESRAIFDLIRGLPDDDDYSTKPLLERLEASRARVDLTDLFNSQGHTALTFAVSQGKLSAMRCLLEFIKQRSEEIVSEVSLSNSGSEKDLIDR